MSIHNARADGTKYELFGPNAKKGMSELKSGTNQPRSAERRRPNKLELTVGGAARQSRCL
jgi:hypothetical protein